MDLSLVAFIYIAFASIVPSLLWLFSYLKQDPHPEPRSIIFQLFLIGLLLPPFVALGEILLQDGFDHLAQNMASSILLIILAAFWEELAKYLAARTIFHHEKEFDEMTDAMVYLIIVALGFAASENIIVVLRALLNDPSQDVFRILGLRMIGANLLHTISSGMLGYFLARGLFLRERYSLIKGLVSATLVHSLFNFFVLQISPQASGNIFYLYMVIGLLTVGFAIVLKDFYNLAHHDKQQ